MTSAWLIICLALSLASTTAPVACNSLSQELWTMQVIEAQLTLLLRLSSARRSSRAEVTDDVHVISKLVHCKVSNFCCRLLSLSLASVHQEETTLQGHNLKFHACCLLSQNKTMVYFLKSSPPFGQQCMTGCCLFPTLSGHVDLCNVTCPVTPCTLIIN